jgi:tRNA pseudouridine38-40 synthase
MAEPATFRLTVSYRGAAYAGWQRQRNALAVQQVLEEALQELIGEPIRTTGAGRTDAGVHARGQVVSLTLAKPWAERALVHGTNERLPADVRVLAAAVAPPGFDARRHAQAKEYRYRLLEVPVLSPLDAATAVRLPRAVDRGMLARAAALLPGRHDCTAFASSGGSHRHPYRRILEAEWQLAAEELLFRIVGEGFLRGMVRTLVGTLLEVGSGRRTLTSLSELLGGRARQEAGPSAPPEGLVLQRVWYPRRWGGEPWARLPGVLV